MKPEMLVLQIKDGHVDAEQSCIYCWLHPLDHKVIYVGATWMHPIARAELHLHSNDPNARIVGEHLSEASVGLENLSILSFSVPDSMKRKRLKIGLINQLAENNLLSELYFGIHVERAFSIEDAEIDWLDSVIAQIATHIE